MQAASLAKHPRFLLLPILGSGQKANRKPGADHIDPLVMAANAGIGLPLKSHSLMCAQQLQDWGRYNLGSCLCPSLIMNNLKGTGQGWHCLPHLQASVLNCITWTLISAVSAPISFSLSQGTTASPGGRKGADQIARFSEVTDERKQ